MSQRAFAALAAAALVAAGAGCGNDAKPSIPTQMIEPPPPDTVGATSGGKSKKGAVKHTDTGESAGAGDDK